MFRSIQWRITVWFIPLVIVSMAVLGAYLTSSVRSNQLSNLRTQLENEAKITAEASLLGFSGQEGIRELDTLAKKLGRQIDARITIIALDGTVLGDSNEDPATMENHATRPQVKEALDSGIGESSRYSTTLGKQMMYVAVPITGEDEILGVARVALPLTQVESSVNNIIVIIIIAMAIAAALVILAAWFITRVTTRPLRELTRSSREIASGEFGHKISVDTKDESGQLAHAFNEMSSKLQDMLATVSEDKTRLTGILDNMADGVVLTDTRGNIVLNIITEVERIGDHAEGIAKIVLMIGDEPPLKPLIDIPRMAEKVDDMLHRSLDALIDRDADTAKQIVTEDNEVDDLYDQVFRELLTFMAEDPKTITRATRLIWVAHNLERSADRVTNICERVVYMVTGKMEELEVSKY